MAAVPGPILPSPGTVYVLEYPVFFVPLPYSVPHSPSQTTTASEASAVSKEYLAHGLGSVVQRIFFTDFLETETLQPSNKETQGNLQ